MQVACTSIKLSDVSLIIVLIWYYCQSLQGRDLRHFPHQVLLTVYALLLSSLDVNFS